MAAFKKFMIQHCEKLILVVVVLLCLASAGGTLVRFFNWHLLYYPDAEAPYAVPKDELPRWADTVKNHLVKTTTVMPALEQIDLYSVMHGNITDPIPKLAAIAPQWTVYDRPPDMDIPWGPTRQASGQLDPDARFITAVAPPLNWRVISTPTGVLVMVQGPSLALDGVRWPGEGEVGVLLARNRVDSAKDELSANIINHFVERSSVSGPVEVAALLAAEQPRGAGAAEAAAAETAMGGAPVEPGRPVARPSFFGNRLTAAAAEPAPVEMAAPTPAAAPVPLWRQARGMTPTEAATGTATAADGVVSTAGGQFEDPWSVVTAEETAADQAMRAELKPIRASDASGRRGWHNLGAMQMFDYAFTDEEILEILKTGKLPPNARKPKLVDPTTIKVEGEAAAGEGEATATPEPAASAAMGAAAQSAAAAGVPSDQIDPYEPKYYVFFDDQDIDENAIYRYRFTTFTVAKDLPASLRKLPEYTAYPQRAELADGTARDPSSTLHPSTDVTRGRFAYTFEEMNAFMEESAKADDAWSDQPKTELMEWDPKLGTLKGMVRSDNAPTKRALSYRRGEPCFSRWSYSSIVIIPPTKRILVRGVVPSPSDPQTMMANFQVEMQDGTATIKSPRPFVVTPPEDAKALTWRSWVKTEATAGGERRPLVDPRTGEYVTLGLEEVYNQFMYLRPAPIGGVAKVKNKEYDFTTNWGLVDIRDGAVMTQRYRIKPDGSQEPNGGLTEVKVKIVVLRELRTAKPRYRYLFSGLRLASSATMETRAERIIWDLKLEEEQAKLRAAKAQGAPAGE